VADLTRMTSAINGGKPLPAFDDRGSSAFFGLI
jgi:hypothetical protein